MIACFPILLPDEILASVVARCSDRLGELPYSSVVRSLFGGSLFKVATDLPTKLDAFTHSISNVRLDVDELIDKHTLWPLITAFSSSERRTSIRDLMRSDGIPYLSAGLMATGCPFPVRLQYCPICAKTDRTNFGEAYWHRIHQAPGITVCPHHRVRLIPSNETYRCRAHRLSPAESSIPLLDPIVEPVDGIEFDLAIDAEWVLSHPRFFVAEAEFSVRILRRLIDAGLANYNGHLRLGSIVSGFCHAFKAEVLARTGCSIPSDGETWLERLLRGPGGAQHPLRYLMLARFAGVSLSSLLDKPAPTTPFGCAPWPCLNTVGGHYKLGTVHTCTISTTENGRALVGTFRCELCGMVYVRIGPDRNATDRFRRDHIPVYGATWEQSLLELWSSPTTSLRALSRELGVDPRTAQGQAERLGLNATRPSSRRERKQALQPLPKFRSKKLVDSSKAEWLALRSAHPYASTSELRRLRPALYASLRRNDSSWLREASPKRRQGQDKRARDWHALDNKLISACAQAELELRERRTPVRITQTAVLRVAGYPWVTRKYLQHLPRTRLFLEQISESRVSFAVRRIRAVKSQFHHEGKRVPLWKIIRSAGIRPEIERNPEIQEALHEADQ